MSVFFRLRYGDLRTPFSRSERGSPKQPQRRAAAADCVVSSTRDFSPNARSVRKMRERRVSLYSKSFIKANGHTQTGVSVFFRLRYGDLRTPFSRSERGSPKQPQRRAAAADCVVSSTRDFSPNARSVRKMRERRVPLYSKNFIKAKGHTQTGVSVFFRLRYGDLRTPLSRSERGSSKRRKNEIFPRGVGSERFFREPHQRSKKSEAYRTPVSQP